jgi:hypothetical protein
MHVVPLLHTVNLKIFTGLKVCTRPFCIDDENLMDDELVWIFAPVHIWYIWGLLHPLFGQYIILNFIITIGQYLTSGENKNTGEIYFSLCT